MMCRLLTTPVENVEWSRYLREVSEREKYNSAVVVKLTTELDAAEQLKDDDVSIASSASRFLGTIVNLIVPTKFLWLGSRWGTFTCVGWQVTPNIPANILFISIFGNTVAGDAPWL